MSRDVYVTSQEERDKMSLEQRANTVTYEQRMQDIKAAEKEDREEQKRRRNSPYRKFMQTNLDPNFSKARRELVQACPSAYVILDFLIEHANNYNAIVCSYTVLSEALGYEKATISKAVNELKKRRFLDIVKVGNTNTYIINKRVFWKSWGSNYRYGEFEAMVLISETEQENKTKDTDEPLRQLTIPIMDVKKKKPKQSIEPFEPDGENLKVLPWCGPNDDVYDDFSYGESCIPEEDEIPEE